MPYTAEHKRRTRARIVESARKLFNQRGFVEVSIDDVMSDAGLTRGGFYNHFNTKEELLLASVAAYGECNPTDRWDGVSMDYDAPAPDAARQLATSYLSHAHLHDVPGHCPLVALAADAAHAGPGVQRAYKALLERMITIFEAGAGGDRGTGLALTAMCIGAMLLGRTVGNDGFGEEVLDASRAEAVRILERRRDAAGA
ncbi:MAG: TetR/AcrR family transcriptional regulator [Woeseiaceae bacterium]|nr:TetR/AcrR family transcriptional regulator [Woeseiaceae bacterium]